MTFDMFSTPFKNNEAVIVEMLLQKLANELLRYLSISTSIYVSLVPQNISLYYAFITIWIAKKYFEVFVNIIRKFIKQWICTKV